MHEADSIALPLAAPAEEVGMPRLPEQVARAASEDAGDADTGGPSRRASEPASLPDLARSVRDGETSSSSASIDTLADSPIDAEAGGVTAQVALARGGEEDPKMAAISRYREGLYTYTVSGRCM
jgi:hypothetical protein